MSNKILGIIFPPQFEPFQSYLSLYYINKLLKNYGIYPIIVDANLSFYWWMLNKSKDSQLSCKHSTYLNEYKNDALYSVLNKPGTIYQYRWAINVIEEYLNSLSREVKIGLTYLKVGNRYSSQDLKSYLNNSNNIFRQFFAENEKEILGPREVTRYLISIVVYDQLVAALTLAQEIKRRRAHSKIIVGGPLIARLAQWLREFPFITEIFDIIAPGEAYRILPQVLGLDRLYKGHITPDFGDLPMDRYLSCRPVLPYLVAHGCKWGRCSFCTHHKTYEG
ncbi:MAG: hypothetical protein AB1478_12735, partial [Nitrospirota bacterium]